MGEHWQGTRCSFYLVPKVYTSNEVLEVKGLLSNLKSIATDSGSNPTNTNQISIFYLLSKFDIKVKVGDNCTTDWISIPCATTSTDGGVKQFPGKNPGMTLFRYN